MDIFEHLAMRVDVPRQFAFGTFEIGAVNRKPDRAAVSVGQLADFEQPARAADYNVAPLAFDRPGGGRPRQRSRLLTPGLRSEFAAFAEDHVAQRIERAGIGIVAVDQAQAAVAPPYRQRDRVKSLPQGG